MTSVSKWTRRGSRELLATSIFRVDELSLRHPERGDDVPFYVIHSSDWVNVIPVTPAGEVVLIRQYRAGSDSIVLEIPGGMIDPGEEPIVAAARELAEETGYVPASLEPLGIVQPNPAIQDNRCHTFLARGAECRVAQDFDTNEKIEVFTAPLAEIPEMIRDGRIDHSLVVAAFYHLFVTAGVRAEEGLGS